MASVDDVIAALEQTKQKLATAKTHGLRGATVLGRIRNTVAGALGRLGANSPLLAEISNQENGVVAEVMGIDALAARVDKAIAQARSAAGGGGPASGAA